MPLRLILLALFALVLTAPASAADPQQQAGFELVTTADGTEIGIWYPAHGTPAPRRFGPWGADLVSGAPLPGGRHPLVVISHGTGGNFAGHVDTAVALARAGFVVAALTHPGDNYRDNSRATAVEERPRALGRVIDYMLSKWRGKASVDPARIGAFGFSAGGFTVLAAAGGRPDWSRVERHCVEHPGFFDCTLLRSKPRTATAWTVQRDARIKALVVAAPALGFTFGRAGLAGVTIPVQLWRAADDRILPAPDYADAVRAALPRAPEFHDVPRAGHFDFLAPCIDPAMAPLPCASAAGFDRAAFHADLDAAVVAFFKRTLAAR